MLRKQRNQMSSGSFWLKTSISSKRFCVALPRGIGFGSLQPNHVSSRSARKASGRFHQAASRAEGSAPLPFLRPQAEPHSCSVSKECRCEGQNLGTFGNDGTFGDDYQSTFTSILLPSGSRTNVERPLPAAPVLTSAWVGSRPLRFKVAITS